MPNEWRTIKPSVHKCIPLARKIKARTAEGRWMKNPVCPFSCVSPAGTSNELDVQNEWEENTHDTVHVVLFYRANMNDEEEKNP